MCPDASDPSATAPKVPRVFISAKSGDYGHAGQVFDFLTAAGVPTFFSRESLPELGSSDYRREIDQALDTAQHMIVVASSTENVQASWVEAEWGFFINEKRSGRKRGNLVTVLVGGLKPSELPPSLRYYEAIAFDPASLDKLLHYLQDAPVHRPAARDVAATPAQRLSFREIATFGGPPPVKLITATPDGLAVATGGFDGAIRVYDVATQQRRAFIASARYRVARHEGLITALEFSPDGSLLASGHLDGTVHVWQLEREDEISDAVRHDWAISGLAFSSDSRALATSSKEGVLKVWDIDALGEGRARHGLHRKPAPVVCMTAVRAREWLVVGLVNAANRRYVLQVQDMKEPHEVLATVSLEDAFVLLSVSDDARILAAGGADGTVRIYDFAAASEALGRQQALKALAPIASLDGHSKPISSITLFPDGCFLATSAMDSKIIVWDLQTAKPAFRLQAAAGEQFASAAVVHGGRELAAALADGRVRVWEAVR